MNNEIAYFLALSTLFLVPKFLQRFNIPSAVSSIALGMIAAVFVPELANDQVVKTFAIFGIISLFVLAGLEVSPRELRDNRLPLLQHVSLSILSTSLIAIAVQRLLGIEWRAAILFSLAVLTPSAGFILDSLASLKATEHEKSWIKSKAIAAEIFALIALFAVTRSMSLMQFATSALALAGLILAIPVIFQAYNRYIAPHAPNTEFGLIMVIGSLAALLTRQIGVYYLVGAFVVGFAARRFSRELGHKRFSRLVTSLESFAALFIPFYFLRAGVKVVSAGFATSTIMWGLALMAMIIPIRLFMSVSHRSLIFSSESWRTSGRIAMALIPTLVFTLVLADILKETFGLSPDIYNALCVYAIGTALLPSMFMHSPMFRIESPHVELETTENSA